jgi:hypothetical protein
MDYSSSIQDLILPRQSCRSYGRSLLVSEQRERLRRVWNDSEKPFWGNSPRFDIVDLGPPGPGRMAGTYGMIKGAGAFLVGVVKRGPGDMEIFVF